MIIPRITISEAAEYCKTSKQTVQKRIIENKLKYEKLSHRITLQHETIRKLYKIKIKPQVIALQIVKGGTGKSTLSMNIAIRASLYGLKVLCLDLDQQANLTELFGIDSSNQTVMNDLIQNNNKDLNINKFLIKVAPGIDLLPSKLNNAALDDTILIKG